MDMRGAYYERYSLRQPQHIFKYLTRYTHRIAISNQRLVALEHGHVVFRWKDYKRGHRLRTMTLEAVEFLRRFMLHVLPRGFMQF
jgi:Putative transposase